LPGTDDRGASEVALDAIEAVEVQRVGHLDALPRLEPVRSADLLLALQDVTAVEELITHLPYTSV
jgi:hypothetical protein